jgi:hypothetical protein
MAKGAVANGAPVAAPVAAVVAPKAKPKAFRLAASLYSRIEKVDEAGTLEVVSAGLLFKVYGKPVYAEIQFPPMPSVKAEAVKAAIDESTI